MQLFWVVGFITLTGIVVAAELELPKVGGRKAIGPEDEDNVLKAQDLIKDTIEKQWKNEDGYNHTVTLKDVKVTKQIVNGVLYHFQFQAVHKFVCSGTTKDCQDKPSLAQTCTAKVYKSPNSDSKVEFAQNTDGPQCHYIFPTF